MHAFELELFEFEAKPGCMASTMIPRRTDSPAPAAARPLGANEKIVLDALRAAVADDPRDPPLAPDIPRHVKGATFEQWQASAIRYLPHDHGNKKREAFARAVKSLVANNTVRHVEGFSWLP